MTLTGHLSVIHCRVSINLIILKIKLCITIMAIKLFTEKSKLTIDLDEPSSSDATQEQLELCMKDMLGKWKVIQCHHPNYNIGG